MKVFIYNALARWDADYQSTAFFIAKELSKDARTIYVDNPFTWKDFLSRFGTDQMSRRRKGFFFSKSALQPVESSEVDMQYLIMPLMLPVNFIRNKFLYQMLQSFNQRRAERRLKNVLRNEGIENYILFNSFNPFYPFFSFFKKAEFVFYHCVDRIEDSKYIRVHGKMMQEKLVSNDEVITYVTAKELQEDLSRVGGDVRLLPNAVEIDRFLQIEAPQQLKEKNERFTIGYIGNVCQRIDYHLLVKVATSFPEATIVLIGPITDQEVYSSGLSEMQNVKLEGKRPYDMIPSLIAGFDCCLIPFKVNSLTRGIYPLKINEYLALGKPVVSTSFSPDIVDFAQYIYLAQDADEYVANVGKALNEDGGLEEERISVARGNSWEKRASVIKKEVGIL